MVLVCPKSKQAKTRFDLKREKRVGSINVIVPLNSIRTLNADAVTTPPQNNSLEHNLSFVQYNSIFFVQFHLSLRLFTFKKFGVTKKRKRG